MDMNNPLTIKPRNNNPAQARHWIIDIKSEEPHKHI